MVLSSDYDQTCNVDEDCEAVLSGDVCPLTCNCGTNCSLDAINVRQHDAYLAALSAAWTPYSPMIPPCGTSNACCQAGRCVARCAPPADAGVGLPIGDASDGPNYTVLCVGDAGPSDAAYDADIPAVPGVSRWCNGPEMCTAFNGGWQCCVSIGPTETCIPP
jgi:hypothetical protein